MYFRFARRVALLASFIAAGLPAQSPKSAPGPNPVSPAAVTPDLESKSGGVSSAEAVPEVKPDRSDPGVVRAQQNLDRVRSLVSQGVLPPLNLAKAQDDLNDALDMSILRFSALSQDLVPEQADQMVTVAERMLLRRQHRAMQNAQLASTGVISRAEADTAEAEVIGAKLQLDLAIERANLVRDFARQKSLAEVETEAESHPEWNGQLYTRYDGSGTFTRADFAKISAAFLAAFGHPIPVSADGQTAVHRSMGFDHTGRIDIALSPDQREGVWLLRYLERNRIPYYAFKTAVAHKATGAHIHLGPGSTKLAAAEKPTRIASIPAVLVRVP
jgi:hypothetical protein